MYRNQGEAPRVAVLIPARNEEQALPELLGRLSNTSVPGLEAVVVVDNGSTDATARVAAAAGARVVSEPKAGYGRACRRGIRAISAGAQPPDVVVFLDADDYLAALQVSALTAPIRAGAAEMVVGERRSRTGEGVRRHAAFGNALILWFLRGVYGDTTRDMGPFRAIRFDCLWRLGLDDPDFGWYVQMQIRALRDGWRVASIPVSFRRRVHGRSKVSGSLRGSVAAGWVMLRTLAREILRSPPERRPYRLAGRIGGSQPTDSRRSVDADRTAGSPEAPRQPRAESSS